MGFPGTSQEGYGISKGELRELSVLRRHLNKIPRKFLWKPPDKLESMVQKPFGGHGSVNNALMRLCPQFPGPVP